MGYTHYWYRTKELDETKFKLFVADCKKICTALAVPLGDGYGENEPIFNNDTVVFNGRADKNNDDSCECFVVNRLGEFHQGPNEDGLYFNFTKTRCLPYDINVQCCLIALKEHFGDKVEIRSDGDNKDWNKATKHCGNVLGYGLTFELD